MGWGDFYPDIPVDRRPQVVGVHNVHVVEVPERLDGGVDGLILLPLDRDVYVSLLRGPEDVEHPRAALQHMLNFPSRFLVPHLESHAGHLETRNCEVQPSLHDN